MLFSDSQVPNVLITGGAGFIGVNLAAHLLATTDARITIFDNLSHGGAAGNLSWLRAQARPDRLRFIRGDVRIASAVSGAVRGMDEIYHFAATLPDAADSRTNVNDSGTFNLLHAARASGRRPMVFYISTASLCELLPPHLLHPNESRYVPIVPGFVGLSERAPAKLDSPALSSAALAENHVLEYTRTYDQPAVVLRPDTVAGPRQTQGWAAHLVYSVLRGEPVVVYGNGLQVREVLHVSDLVQALIAARDFRAITAGHAYNVGGGISHTVSVLEMLELIERVCHRKPLVHYAPAKPGDRLFYMSDSSAFRKDTGWFPRRSIEQTVREVAAFWHANQQVAKVSQRPRVAHPSLRAA